MNADAAASMDAEGVTGAMSEGGVSGAGAGSTRLDFRISPLCNKPVNGRLEVGSARGLSGGRGPESKRNETYGCAAMHPVPANVRNRTMQAEQRGSGQVSRARNGSSNTHPAATTRQSQAIYSKDFQDSTKGTALLSPPDSTASPLDWTPALNYGFVDITEQPFFKPSLHGGFSQKGRVAARAKAPPDLSTSFDDSLRVRVPDPLADLASH
jgi:hypothetical protein